MSDVSSNDPNLFLTSIVDSDLTLPDGSAEDVILSWLISLPTGLDPARAAASLGENPSFSTTKTGEKGRLTAMLREIAKYPAYRLSGMRRSRSRVAYLRGVGSHT